MAKGGILLPVDAGKQTIYHKVDAIRNKISVIATILVYNTKEGNPRGNLTSRDCCNLLLSLPRFYL